MFFFKFFRIFFLSFTFFFLKKKIFGVPTSLYSFIFVQKAKESFQVSRNNKGLGNFTEIVPWNLDVIPKENYFLIFRKHNNKRKWGVHKLYWRCGVRPLSLPRVNSAFNSHSRPFGPENSDCSVITCDKFSHLNHKWFYDA